MLESSISLERINLRYLAFLVIIAFATCYYFTTDKSEAIEGLRSEAFIFLDQSYDLLNKSKKLFEKKPRNYNEIWRFEDEAAEKFREFIRVANEFRYGLYWLYWGNKAWPVILELREAHKTFEKYYDQYMNNRVAIAKIEKEASDKRAEEERRQKEEERMKREASDKPAEAAEERIRELERQLDARK